MKRYKDYITPNILPFPNIIDAMSFFNETAEYFVDKFLRGVE